ncbi:MAG: hypothetical protein QNJ92_16195 [Alphaproteobacteria bacterium]|nr:hypothetical protein [Alphaproteobacteria bacterium]
MSDAPSRAIKLFGTEEPPAETRLLTAGPLSAELDAGNLRYIRFGGKEALRAISYVVRDQYWGTFNPTIENLQVDEQADSFTVLYDAVCTGNGQEFRYKARITGASDGTLRFDGIGTPVTDFLTNRTGFVVLHGVEGISGHPAGVLHVDGREVATEFPQIIDPKQPIMDIRALTHTVAPGLKVICTMEGDTFEMEDQRNWTDASYKTYVRPLGLPHPYTLKAGETIEQAVELRFQGQAPSTTRSSGGERVTVSVSAAAGRVPRFAMALEAQHAADALTHEEALSLLEPEFLSCYFDAREAGTEHLRGFKEMGDLLDTDVALEAVVPGASAPRKELRAIAGQAEDADVRFASVAVTPASDLSFVMPGTVFPDTKAFDALYAAAREAFPDTPLGGGTFVYFTELNRKPPPVDALDFVCHTTCAIVHAADDRSVTETIESLPYVIVSARALVGDKEYRVGPGSIGSRTSPFGGPTAPNPHNGRVTMTRNDPRQRALLGAAWHLGYGARMAEGGVDTVILGAPIGPFGLIHHSMDYPQPWFDQEGGLYPAYHVMRALYAASGSMRRVTTVSAPRNVQALGYEDDGDLVLWLANLTGDAQTITVDGLGGGNVELCVLDEETFVNCAQDPEGLDDTSRSADPGRIELGPYAVARLSVAG